MADNDDKNPTKPATSAQPGFDPKPVQVGGESLIERLVPHMKQIAIGAVVIAVVVSAVMIVMWVKQRGREKETAKLAQVIDVSQRQVRPPGVEPDATKQKEPTFASNKDRATAVLAELDKAGAKIDGAFRASMLVQADRLDDAIAEYKKHTTGTTLDAVLAREGLGIALEMKAEKEKDAATRQTGLEEALAAFQAMQPNEKGPRYAYALYHQGRILALLGKNAEAKAQLEKAKELGKDGSLPNLIEERLASISG